MTNPSLAKGLNAHHGHLTNEPVALAHGLDYTPVGTVLA
jgi:alanine dehydrogenase